MDTADALFLIRSVRQVRLDADVATFALGGLLASYDELLDVLRAASAVFEMGSFWRVESEFDGHQLAITVKIVSEVVTVHGIGRR